MQGLLPAALTRPSLSLANLASHTQQLAPAPRRTVQLYLQDQYHTRGEYELGPPASDEFEGVETSGGAGRKRKAEEEGGSTRRERERRKDTALVLHAFDDPAGSPAQAASSQPAKKRPTLAGALRPRVSGATLLSSPAPPATKKQRGEEGAGGPSGSSEVLVARVDRREKAAEGEKRERKGKGKAKEVEQVDEPIKEKEKNSAAKKKGKLRAEPVNNEEAEELEDRLRGRRERRANKAFIRKDRTQSAAALGAAAASKVKASSSKAKAKKRKAASDASSVDEDEEDEEPKKRKKRRSKEGESRVAVQEMQRPGGIGSSRLTLKPPKALGIFNKGKASVRTKVGKQLPDLAFSELNFLNGPRPSPPSSPSQSSSSSSAEDAYAGPAFTQTKLPRTYGSKTKTRRSSSFFPPLDEEAENAPGAAGRAVRSPAMAKKTPTKEKKKEKEKQVKAQAVKSKKPARLVFSHVEIPLRRSSSSASNMSLARLRSVAPIRSPNKPARRAIAAAAAPDCASTADSALSAASLARRNRARPSAAVEAEEEEEEAPSMLGGFDVGLEPEQEEQVDEHQHHQQQRFGESSSSVNIASLYRALNEAYGEGSIRVDEREEQQVEQHVEQQTAGSSSVDVAAFLPLLRASSAVVDEVDLASTASAAPFLPGPAPGGAFFPSLGGSAAPSLVGGHGEEPVEYAEPAAFFPDALPAADSAPAVFSSVSSLDPSVAPSALPSSAADHPPAFLGLVSSSALLRSSSSPAKHGSNRLEDAVLGDVLQDEQGFREAMRRQWPRTRC
ncbi:hypothetical protein JCM8097_003126 [Rhodosporidiobolus ruineniae]